ncbi:LOW QUALITY PROTEIN: matrix remodeling-associated protein 8 [Neophocaena asiaeorientalis asiaeorientalis]|uniref:LOW QUALITY PROTEIN: matrix remodeling-associated protein 8 n=1 Tax=Neophocaena asiaeorientalis asiaeorientalis TaxID=1706337 RepID=A0A341CQD9_NEOAA|nr:LOW QUALITY PROTEIN: matrix remodeling-associated protein 8 [Neophocaena asiaeorientalis asiaeorientalis]
MASAVACDTAPPSGLTSSDDGPLPFGKAEGAPGWGASRLRTLEGGLVRHGPRAGATPDVHPGQMAMRIKRGPGRGSSVLLSSGPARPATPGSSVVSESAVSWAAGARAVLRCQSPRMVWTQDRLHDRQRVVHWDLSGGPAGGPARRLMDMYSAGEQRVYEPRDSGRLLLTPSAFQDGNFSLLIRAVEDTDEGLYTCNLHHHYCHLSESKKKYSDKKSKSKGKDVNMVESAVAAGDQALYRREDIRLGYKNNLLKERVELSHSPLPAKSIDLDKGRSTANKATPGSWLGQQLCQLLSVHLGRLFLTPMQLAWPPFQRLVPLSWNLAWTGAG